MTKHLPEFKWPEFLYFLGCKNWKNQIYTCWNSWCSKEKITGTLIIPSFLCGYVFLLHVTCNNADWNSVEMKSVLYVLSPFPDFIFILCLCTLWVCQLYYNHLFNQRFILSSCCASIALQIISIDLKYIQMHLIQRHWIKWSSPHIRVSTVGQSRTCGDAALSLPHCLTLRRLAHFTIWAPFFTSTVSGYIGGEGLVAEEGQGLRRRGVTGAEQEIEGMLVRESIIKETWQEEKNEGGRK